MNREAMRDLLEWCREERQQAQESIPRFEMGEMKIGSIVDGQLVDQSAEHVADLKRIVSDMDRLIGAIERDLG